jgi:hypothetical protein
MLPGNIPILVELLAAERYIDKSTETANTPQKNDRNQMYGERTGKIHNGKIL